MEEHYYRKMNTNVGSVSNFIGITQKKVLDSDCKTLETVNPLEYRY